MLKVRIIIWLQETLYGLDTIILFGAINVSGFSEHSGWHLLTFLTQLNFMNSAEFRETSGILYSLTLFGKFRDWRPVTSDRGQDRGRMGAVTTDLSLTEDRGPEGALTSDLDLVKKEWDLAKQLLKDEITVDEFLNKDITSENGLMFKNLIQRLINIWDEIPEEYMQFLNDISSASPVTGLLQATKPEALNILNNYCHETLDLRHPQNKDKTSFIQVNFLLSGNVRWTLCQLKSPWCSYPVTSVQ